MPVFRDVHGRLYRIPAEHLETYAIESDGSERFVGAEVAPPSNEQAPVEASGYVWQSGEQAPIEASGYVWQSGEQTPFEASGYVWQSGEQTPIEASGYVWQSGEQAPLESSGYKWQSCEEAEAHAVAPPMPFEAESAAPALHAA